MFNEQKHALQSKEKGSKWTLSSEDLEHTEAMGLDMEAESPKNTPRTPKGNSGDHDDPDVTPRGVVNLNTVKTVNSMESVESLGGNFEDANDEVADENVNTTQNLQRANENNKGVGLKAKDSMESVKIDGEDDYEDAN